MKKIGILNTSIATENTGDAIIMDSCLHELAGIMREHQVIHFPTHEKLSSISYNIQRHIDYNVACGTNLLHSHMGLVKQWNIGLRAAFKLRPVVLLGVGWRSQVKRHTDLYTKWLLRKVLSTRYTHSVRDSYAERQLRDCSITNVVNTGCPTLWMLDRKHCATIPAKKGKHAVITLTDYSRSPELDTGLVNFVLSSYEKCYFWCQGTNDMQYLRQSGLADKLTIIPASLAAYDALLSDASISLDYIGTRLHGGIRAMQKLRRAIIIGVDHRANVMGSDFNLPVIDRYVSPDRIYEKILEDRATDIHLPTALIENWKAQFRPN